MKPQPDVRSKGVDVMRRLLKDVIVVGTALFVLGTWMTSHHSHKIVTQEHPDHKVRDFLIYTCVGIALITVGSNMMTDGLIRYSPTIPRSPRSRRSGESARPCRCRLSHTIQRQSGTEAVKKGQVRVAATVYV